jgi:tRNA (guanine6-N2)-methyltransferase
MKHKPKKTHFTSGRSGRQNVGQTRKNSTDKSSLNSSQKSSLPQSKIAQPLSDKPLTLEVEFLPGLETFVQKELETFGCFKILQKSNETFRCHYLGDIKKLFTLRRVVSVNVVHAFNIPRPKALLGDEHLRRLTTVIEGVLAINLKNTFESFRISAAGQESSVFQKLIEVLSQQIVLPFDKEGDLLLSVRPASLEGKIQETRGWEIAVRLTPRPLSARAWRVYNIPGGLNATLAAVMNDLAAIAPTDRYLNAMCGSGTLLIETELIETALIEAGKTTRAIGVDISPQALECALQNLQAASVKAELLQADATRLPFADESFEVITADLPWGDAVGSHEGNATLYPAFLKEMARVSSGNARLVVLTHEVKRFEAWVNNSLWQIKAQYRVYHGGHYPRLYLLKKT